MEDTSTKIDGNARGQGRQGRLHDERSAPHPAGLISRILDEPLESFIIDVVVSPLLSLLCFQVLSELQQKEKSRWVAEALGSVEAAEDGRCCSAVWQRSRGRTQEVGARHFPFSVNINTSCEGVACFIWVTRLHSAPR